MDAYLLRYRIHDGQSTHRMHRNLLMQHKALHFSRFAVEHWKQGFQVSPLSEPHVIFRSFCVSCQIWGNGRDGKRFYKSLTAEARALVLCFLEIDQRKHGLLYDGKKIVDIAEAAPPFVCCVAIGKNNGIEEKLAPFQNGSDYFQLC